MARLSVLIPTFNRQKYLPDALDSLLEQTCQDFEVVIYDDGSSDLTQNIVSRYIEEFNRGGVSVFYLKSQENKGVSYARNELIKFATSELLVWQDSDDISRPDRFERLVNEIDKSNADMVFSYMKFFKYPQSPSRIKQTYKLDSSKYKDYDSINGNMAFATGIFKKWVTKMNFFDEPKRRGEDLDWLVKVTNAGAKFSQVNLPLYYCRRHGGRLTKGGR